MKAVHVLGHIDCPTCGTVGGMRITADKNGDPFGYCEAECSQQLRVGGDARRVRKFLARYPWAAGGEPAKPVTGTEQKPTPAPEPEPEPAPKKRASWADGLAALGVTQ
jgi:hypothetical protein